MTYRVLLLQGEQIYCPTLLIPEMGDEIFLKGGCKWSFKKKAKNRRNVEYLKAQQLIPIIPPSFAILQ
jgi:hypothetical protein